jgi:hypothetical protein
MTPQFSPKCNKLLVYINSEDEAGIRGGAITFFSKKGLFIPV